MPSPPLSSNSLGLQLLESVWIGFLFTLVIIAARIYTRTRIVRQLNWDDHLMLTAFVSSNFCGANKSVILIECCSLSIWFHTS